MFCSRFLRNTSPGPVPFGLPVEPTGFVSLLSPTTIRMFLPVGAVEASWEGDAPAPPSVDEPAFPPAPVVPAVAVLPAAPAVPVVPAVPADPAPPLPPVIPPVPVVPAEPVAPVAPASPGLLPAEPVPAVPVAPAELLLVPPVPDFAGWVVPPVPDFAGWDPLPHPLETRSRPPTRTTHRPLISTHPPAPIRWYQRCARRYRALIARSIAICVYICRLRRLRLTSAHRRRSGSCPRRMSAGETFTASAFGVAARASQASRSPLHAESLLGTFNRSKPPPRAPRRACGRARAP